MTFTISGLLEEIQLEDLKGSEITKSRLRPSQIDITRNLWFHDDVNFSTIINLFYKSKVPRNFTRLKEKMQNSEGNYFCILSKGFAEIKAYDKVAHLRRKGELPPELIDKHILRFEVSMKRPCFIQKLGVDRDEDLDQILTIAYQNAEKIIDDYHWGTGL